MIDQHPPLVSLLLIGYQVERFIAAAIEGAFAQTYSPLEIVLSDDCSSDGTFNVMQARAAAYVGPHRVVLNRNAQNRGISDHVNQLLELVRGEWIVIANGDDVSLAHRTVTLMQCAAAAGDGVFSLLSGYEIINQEDQHVAYVTENNRAVGATHAWRRDSFTRFGKLLPGTSNDDEAMIFRSRLLGVAGFVPEVLVKYRTHDGNLWSFAGNRRHARMSRGDQRQRILARLRSLAVLHGQYLLDLERLAPTARTLELERQIQPPYEVMAGVLTAHGMSLPEGSPSVGHSRRRSASLHSWLLHVWPGYYNRIQRLQATRLSKLAVRLPRLLPSKLPLEDAIIDLQQLPNK